MVIFHGYVSHYQRVISAFRGFSQHLETRPCFCSMGQPSSASPSQQLSQGEKYEILAVLGSGSFGEVREVAW